MSFFPHEHFALESSWFQKFKTIVAFYTICLSQFPSKAPISLYLSFQLAFTSILQHGKAIEVFFWLLNWLPGTTSAIPSLLYESSRNSSMSSLPPLDSTTTYIIAHPPPLTSPALQSAKLLLQLQEFRPTSRPRPAFEVIPATSLVPKLFRRSSRIVRDKTGYGVEDMLIVHAEDYECPGRNDKSETADDDYTSRTQYGAICHHYVQQANGERPLRETEIRLADGTAWKAQRVTNTCYDFTLQSEDEEHFVARWTSRISSRETSSKLSQRKNSSTHRRFIFTVLDPDKKRHPALGTLQDELTIFHSYPPTQCGSSKVINISEQLRSLMLISGIWVAFMEGRSSLFTRDQSGTSLLSVNSGSVNSLLSGIASSNQSCGSVQSPTPNSKQNRLQLSLQARQSPEARSDASRMRSSSLPSPTAAHGQSHNRCLSVGSYFVRSTDEAPADATADANVQLALPQKTDDETVLQTSCSDDSDGVCRQSRNDGATEAASFDKIAPTASNKQQDQRRRLLRFLARMKQILRTPWRRHVKSKTYIA